MDEIAAPFGMASLVAARALGAAFRGGHVGRRFGADLRDQRQGDALLARDVVKRFAALLVAAALCWAPSARAENPADADMAKKRAAEIGLAPGMTLDSSTASLAKGLLPPEVLQ